MNLQYETQRLDFHGPQAATIDSTEIDILQDPELEHQDFEQYVTSDEVLEVADHDRYSLDNLVIAPILQENCGVYWIVGTTAVLPIFLRGGCVPGDFVEHHELEFMELLLSGQVAVLLDDEGGEHRVRYNCWNLEIDGLVYSRDDEVKEPGIVGTRQLVRWE